MIQTRSSTAFSLLPQLLDGGNPSTYLLEVEPGVLADAIVSALGRLG